MAVKIRTDVQLERVDADGAIGSQSTNVLEIHQRRGKMTKPLTCHEFLEEFNTVSFNYDAFRSTIAVAKIVDKGIGEEVEK